MRGKANGGEEEYKSECGEAPSKTEEGICLMR
jgi:hypothetical protein